MFSDLALEKFWSRVDTSAGPDGCWPWQGSLSGDGYGSFTIDGKTYATHRVSYIIAHGAIPASRLVCHDCPLGDNPRCVNPRHLWAGTQKQNMEDMVQKGRSAIGDRNGQRQHPERRAVGVRNGRATIGAEQVSEIRRLVATGATQCAVAQRLGIPRSTVGSVARGETWQSIPDR